MRSGLCSARPTSVRLIGESESFSWPTPSAWDGDPRRGLPATSADQTMMHKVARGSITASGLPSDDLKLAVSMWGTPRASDGDKGGPNMSFGAGGQPLPSQAAQWPTPSATSYGTNQGGAAGRSGKVRPSLETMVRESMMWPTPTTRDWKDGACADANVPTNGLLGRAAVRGPLALKTSTAGETTSSSTPTARRQLNPRFVEALMGWPKNWSTPYDSAAIRTSSYERTACASSVTESFPRKPSELSSSFGSDYKSTLKPILKWAGGKTWLLSRLVDLYAQHRHRRLVEPFVGSMAVALGLCPQRALLADVNRDLVALHNRLRDPRPFEFVEVTTDEQYKALRDRFNESNNLVERGELFYALNRTGFNGVCRYNKSGIFNVPWGKQGRRGTAPNLQREFPEHAAAIKNWEIIVADFSVVLVQLQHDDFLYIDPPYDGTFSDYAEGGFTWDEQERLAVEAAEHTGPIVASNSSTSRILKLYQDLGFAIELLDAPRRISSNGNRDSVKEMLATKNVLDTEVTVGLIINSTVSTKEHEQQETGELEMANLPKGWGQQVANADATIQRQDLKAGDYVFDHIVMFGKDTKAGPAIIIEHKIVSSKPIKEGVEPMAAGTKWGFFLPGYGKAKVMQLPNMKSYFVGMFGIDEAKMLQSMVASGMTMEQAKAKFAHDLGEVIDSWGEGAGRGYRVRGVTFETTKEDGDGFTGMNWYPLLSENTPDQVSKRAAELGADAAQSAAANSTPSVPAGPSAFPQIPPADPMAAAVAAGWKEHPQNPTYMYLGTTGAYKTKADILAGK